MKPLNSFIKLGLLSLFFVPAGCTQNTSGVHVQNPDFDQRLSRLLEFDVPVISVDSFYRNRSDFFILDTRTPQEYEVSHIKGAKFLDYTQPDFSIFRGIPYDKPIVVYCSVGYRSEKIGKKLQELGYTTVSNLYGSIFEWVNEGFPVVDTQGQPTDSLHTYNRKWSRYVNNPLILKTW